jgi:hemerythrin superfamily protein
MDAIKLLKQQHRLVEKLFERFEDSDDGSEQLELFAELADQLAVHATIEERHFYPAVRARQTEEDVEEAYDEHLEIKKLLVDAMGSTDDPELDAKVGALKAAVVSHFEEEESALFPEVKELLDEDTLEALGEIMESETLELMEQGAPRETLRVELEPPSMQP